MGRRIRTHMVVCVGACLIMIVSAFGFGDSLTSQNVVGTGSRSTCNAPASLIPSLLTPE
jgi:uncharacterized membrane protein YhiD involved in acid resistance